MLACNPFKSIWRHPRSTIKEISEVKPNYRLFTLSFIYGFGSLLSLSQTFSLGFLYSVVLIVLFAAILAPIWGYLVFNISSFFLWLTGKWIGGEGSFKKVRAAIAWSNAPMMFNVMIWVLLLLFFGSHLFQDFPGSYFFSSMEFWILFGLLLAQFIISVWVVVLYIILLSEVHKFSVFRSIVNIIIAFVLVGAILAIGIYLYHFLLGVAYDAN